MSHQPLPSNWVPVAASGVLPQLSFYLTVARCGSRSWALYLPHFWILVGSRSYLIWNFLPLPLPGLFYQERTFAAGQTRSFSRGLPLCFWVRLFLFYLFAAGFGWVGRV